MRFFLSLLITALALLGFAGTASAEVNPGKLANCLFVGSTQIAKDALKIKSQKERDALVKAQTGKLTTDCKAKYMTAGQAPAQQKTVTATHVIDDKHHVPQHPGEAIFTVSCPTGYTPVSWSRNNPSGGGLILLLWATKDADSVQYTYGDTSLLEGDETRTATQTVTCDLKG